MTDTSSKQCSTRGYKWIHIAVTTVLLPIEDVHVDGDKGYKWIQLVFGLHVSGVNAALGAVQMLIMMMMMMMMMMHGMTL